MLALGVDYGKQGERKGQPRAAREGGRAMPAWHTSVSGAMLARESGINIKQKISQWEGLSLQENGHGGKARCTPVSSTFSDDERNGVLVNNKNDVLCTKIHISKAKSFGLDFRENQASHVRKSEPEQKQTCFNQVVTSTPVTKPPALTAKQTPVKISDARKPNSNHCELRDLFSDYYLEHLDDSLPPGNFYTSRGFWRKVETNDTLWKRQKDHSSISKHLGSEQTDKTGTQIPITPPPKPQRTFQYKGADSPSAHSLGEKKLSSPESQLKLQRKSDTIHPPAVPPPSCPGTATNGFSRNKKNR